MTHFAYKAGIGLRQPHYQDLLTLQPNVGFLEAHSENYFNEGSPNRHYLRKAAELYPISLHGVGLSLGSADGLDKKHLKNLRTLVDEIQPFHVSDHVSWSHEGGVHVPDLLPLPYTQEALDVICNNIDQMQNALGRSVLVENPSTYLKLKDVDMDEVSFLTEITRRTGCKLLLDLNNILVSAHNTGLNATQYLNDIQPDTVGEIHLAGYHVNTLEDGEEVWIDTHGYPVYDALWAFYRDAIQKLGPITTLIEWDTDIPQLDVLIAEAHKADAICTEVLKAA